MFLREGKVDKGVFFENPYGDRLKRYMRLQSRGQNLEHTRNKIEQNL